MSPTWANKTANSYALGFRELRPVQALTVAAVLGGDNCVVLAPTAGGKTEAVFFPLLSLTLMDTEDWKPVSVLYLSPIRALHNNQEARLERMAGVIGRRVFKWHGDASSRAKQRFLRTPADVLLSTPESVEAMLMSSRVSADVLFEGLRAVVIDEVHSFADDDRGAHLCSVLQRLAKCCGRDVQRLGLSATVGNPTGVEHGLGEETTARNFNIELSDDAGKSLIAVREVLRELARSHRPNEVDARAFASTESGAISKFAPCLPETLLRDLVAWVTLDGDGARRVVHYTGPP